jgi:hypothetical protein
LTLSDGQQRIATARFQVGVVAYATSTMWQEVERPALTLSGTSFARKPFEQAVCRLVEPEVSHSDKTSLQRAGEALTLMG